MHDADDPDEDLTAEEHFRLSRDLRAAAATLTDREARYLVDAYYQAQKDRIRNAHQARAAEKSEEPHAVLDWFRVRSALIERSIGGALGVYARSHKLGRWCLSIHAVGPVITAGLLAHIDITRAPTVGHIWSFAGLNPDRKWGKKEKRPWNASLKTLCWKIGQSFMKLRANDKDVYGAVYEQRKALEVERNEAGAFAETARKTLEERNFRDKETRATYEAGRLPAGRLDLRAQRYAVKLFLAHFHHVAYELHYGTPPPKPYIIEHGGHTHFIAPPNWPMVE